ncbi:MAG TPA: serine/threonine-protein kinase [Candidatus Limnocylindria bacterium]|nr:serine/threonine-protein kinase [Candidatus Limnocylindria bacterium]
MSDTGKRSEAKVTGGPAEAPDRLIGGRYRLVEHIDSGGAADVWLAHDERLDREVAVKLLGAKADDAFRERFTQEARRAASVTHPNVVTVFDEGQDGDDAYMVMEYVRGRTLRELIAERGPLPPHEASRIVTQIAAALDAAHSAGVLHLDVKPANVILTDTGIAKLADFGVATAAHGEAERELVGTARYVAPERIEGQAPTPRSDVYGLGLVAYELLAGRPAFQGVETDDLLRLRLEGAAPSLRSARIGIAPELDAVVAKALEREPRDRFATAGQLAGAFRGAAERGDHTTPLSAGAAVRSVTRRGVALPALPRLDSTLAVLAVIVVLLGVVALFLNFSGTPLPSAATQRPAATAARATTPNVVGMSLKDADKAAKAAGYQGIFYRVDPALRGKPCSVGRQDPEPGSPLRATLLNVFFIAGKDCLEDDD